MATRYTSIATAALIAGTVGTSLYTASTAQDAREAISAAHDPTTRHGEIIARVDAGGADVTALAPVDPGVPGQVLTVDDAGLPVWRAASSGTSQPTTYYASDGTATVGGAGTSASISGTGSASTVTLGVPASPSTETTTSSTEGGPRWCSPGISQSAQRAVLYLRSTAISNFATGGWRWSTATLRRTSESPPASLYLGASWSDNSNYGVGDMRSGSNSATYWLGGSPSTSPTEGADRWLRVVWTLADGVFKVHLATGATTGSTRPTYWVPRTATAQEQPSSVTSVGSPGTSTLTICVGLETFGSTGGASSVTYSLALEVTS